MANDPTSLGGREWGFPKELDDLVLGLPLDPQWLGHQNPISHHEEALGHFLARRYFEAHESWEILWKAQKPQSPGRHAFQALIRICAAGVKRQNSNNAGYFHHLRGALGHIASMETTQEPPQRLPPVWEDLANWLRLHSQAEGKLEK